MYGDQVYKAKELDKPLGGIHEAGDLKLILLPLQRLNLPTILIIVRSSSLILRCASVP